MLLEGGGPLPTVTHVNEQMEAARSRVKTVLTEAKMDAKHT